MPCSFHPNGLSVRNKWHSGVVEQWEIFEPSNETAAAICRHPIKWTSTARDKYHSSHLSSWLTQQCLHTKRMESIPLNVTDKHGNSTRLPSKTSTNLMKAIYKGRNKILIYISANKFLRAGSYKANLKTMPIPLRRLGSKLKETISIFFPDQQVALWCLAFSNYEDSTKSKVGSIIWKCLSSMFYDDILEWHALLFPSCSGVFALAFLCATFYQSISCIFFPRSTRWSESINLTVCIKTGNIERIWWFFL